MRQGTEERLTILEECYAGEQAREKTRIEVNVCIDELSMRLEQMKVHQEIDAMGGER